VKRTQIRKQNTIRSLWPPPSHRWESLRPPHHHRGTMPLGAARREETFAASKRRSGRPTPIWSGRGDGAAPPQAAREKLQGNGPGPPCQPLPPRTRAPPMSQRKKIGEARRPKNLHQPKSKKALRCKGLAPRHHSWAGRNSNTSAATPPLSLASTTVQEWRSG
jgi:hypothetical protein